MYQKQRQNIFKSRYEKDFDKLDHQQDMFAKYSNGINNMDQYAQLNADSLLYSTIPEVQQAYAQKYQDDPDAMQGFRDTQTTFANNARELDGDRFELYQDLQHPEVKFADEQARNRFYAERPEETQQLHESWNKLSTVEKTQLMNDSLSDYLQKGGPEVNLERHLHDFDYDGHDLDETVKQSQNPYAGNAKYSRDWIKDQMAESSIDPQVKDGRKMSQVIADAEDQGPRDKYSEKTNDQMMDDTIKNKHMPMMEKQSYQDHRKHYAYEQALQDPNSPIGDFEAKFQKQFDPKQNRDYQQYLERKKANDDQRKLNGKNWSKDTMKDAIVGAFTPGVIDAEMIKDVLREEKGYKQQKDQTDNQQNQLGAIAQRGGFDNLSYVAAMAQRHSLRRQLESGQDLSDTQIAQQVNQGSYYDSPYSNDAAVYAQGQEAGRQQGRNEAQADMSF